MKVGLIVALVTLGTLAGCLGTDPAPPAAASSSAFTLDLPVHVVAVGFEDFDEEALRRYLEPPAGFGQPVHPFNGVRLYTNGVIDREPLRYNVQYMVHEAPPGFAAAFAAAAKATAVEGQADDWLRGYDRFGGLELCERNDPSPLELVPPLAPAEPSCPVDRLDAVAVQEWLASNAASFQLDFEGPGYTVFLVDTYTQGLLPRDRYHYWTIGQDVLLTGSVSGEGMRAWGGDHDFVFLDVGSAPNPADEFPWGNISRQGGALGDLRDGPVWEYSGDGERLVFYENLARNVYDAARILWARIPLYPVEYAEHYVLPMYVFVDPRAHANPASPLSRVKFADLEARTQVDVIAKAFQDLAPWAKVDVEVKYVYLPDDDPALAAVLDDAKRRGHPLDTAMGQGSTSVDFGVVKRYFRENWDAYVPQVEGARVYPTFAFWLEHPSSSLFAYSDSDALGRSWGVFVNVADAFRCTSRATSLKSPVCFVEDVFPTEDAWWSWWNAVLVHELGHSFGLTHTHDTISFDDGGYPTYDLNWLWDSTASVMTYRHTIPYFDAFDKEWLLRHQAANLALPLAASGSARVRDLAQEALRALEAGDYAHALEDAQAAMRAANALAPFDVELGQAGEPVTRRVELRAAMTPDYLYVAPTDTGISMSATESLHYAKFPLEIPGGAHALEFRIREVDAPSHFGWSGWLDVVNADGDNVAGAYNNGFDDVVLMNLARCAGGCEVYVLAYSGLGNEYDVTITPYDGVRFG